ncbi:hypothetical protein ACP4OV_019245 [Aristida adscensionis]
MSTVMASYTAALGRSPAMPVSSHAVARGTCSWRPPPLALKPPAHVGVKCRRRPLTVTCALPERPPAFNIPPTALLCPVPPPDEKERWDIKEEEDCVRLWLQVPGLSKGDIEVRAGEDMLEIKRKEAAGAGGQAARPDAHGGVGAFHIRLLMTKEYDSSSVKAELDAGMLELTVFKRKESERGATTVDVLGTKAGQGGGGGGDAGARKGKSRDEKQQQGGDERKGSAAAGAAQSSSSKQP